MNPERWRRIDAMLSAALERPDDERTAFLARACEGDEKLRAEVQRLLAAHQAATGFLEPPPDASAALRVTATWTDPERRNRNSSVSEPSSPASVPVAPGSVLGRYIVLSRLGGGGMGVVYGAYDPQLDRKVALKLLRTEGAALAGRDAQARLLREAQAMARLSHPNVIAVHDVGTLGEEVFIAMEFIDGRTLTRWLKEKERAPREIVEAFLQAGSGLAAAHAAGLVHRDFKPDNVLIAKDGRVKVLDFGLARATEDLLGKAPTVPPRFEPGPSTPRALSEPLTRSGAFFGTPAYMAPEQLLGKATDARTDQFSFCVALHEALYGERPFGGDSLEAIREQVTAGKINEPDNAGRVPRAVRQVLRRGLRMHPDDRHPSMDSLLRELARDPRGTRRRAVALGALALGFAGIALGYREQTRRNSQICKGAERKLAGVWDDERRSALAAAFTATAKPYATDAVRAVQRALDTYARGWVDMHTEACEATRLRGEQSEELLDLRMACLSDRRHELKSLVEIFSRGEASVVEKAPQAALALTALSRCANAVALKAPVAMPADSSLSAQAEELRQKLAQVSALSLAGKYAEGLPIAREAVARSQELRYRPLEADALSRLGTLQARAGDLKGSDKTFHQSLVAALAGRHDEVLALGWIYLIGLGVELGQYERAEEAAGYATAVIERYESAEELRGRLFNSLGALFQRQGKYNEALEQFQRGRETRERALGPEHPDVADSLNNAALVLRHLGHYEKAIENYQRAAAIKEKVFGPNHPWAVGSETNLGAVYAMQGKYDLALLHGRNALDLSEKLLGPRHPSLANALNNIGGILWGLGRYDEAVTYHQRALEIAEKVYGPEHPEVARIQHNIGRALLSAERYQPALERLERAVAMAEKGSGVAHPDLAQMLANLALAVSERHGRGDFELAQGYLRRTLTIREKAVGPESPDLAPFLVDFAEVLKERQPKKALDYLERSLQIRQKSLPPDSPLIPATFADMGDVYLRLRQPLEAKRVLERALQLFQSSGSDSASIPRTRFLMARALWDTHSDREQALTLSRQARDELLKAGRSKSKIYRDVEAWLSLRTPARLQM